MIIDFTDTTFAYILGTIVLTIWLIFSSVRKLSIGRIIFISIYIIYITMVVSITLFPIITDPHIAGAFNDSKIKLIPGSTIIPFLKYGGKDIIIPQIIGNIVMTIPFGAASQILFKFKWKWWFYPLAALLFPLSIEIGQLIMNLIVGCMYRTVDIDDIILNFIGINIGYIFYTAIPESHIRFLSGEEKEKKSKTNGHTK